MTQPRRASDGVKPRARPPAEQAWLTAALLGVYGVVWAPALGQALVGMMWPIWAVVPAFVAIALVGLTLVRRAPLWARVALTVPYWALLLWIHVEFAWTARWMSPTYLYVSAALAIVVALRAAHRWICGAALAVALAVSTGVVAGIVADYALWAKWATIAVGAAALVGLAWLGLRERLSEVSTPSLILFAFAALIYPRAAVTYSLLFPRQAERVLAQPGVTALYDYRDPAARAAFCSQVKYVARQPGSDLFVAGPQGRCGKLVTFAAGHPATASQLDLHDRGADNIVFDPDDANLAYVGGMDNLYQVSLRPLSELKRMPVKHSWHDLNGLRLEPSGRRLFVSIDRGEAAAVVDRRSLATLAWLRGPDNVRPVDLWVDWTGNHLLVNGRNGFSRQVDLYDLTTLAHRRTYRWRGESGFGFSAIDEQGRRVLLASTGSGELQALDLDTLTPTERVRLRPGLRNVSFDAVRRVLAVGNYFDGTLTAVNIEHLMPIGRIFVGLRVRWVEIDDARGRWYVSSAAGGFAIDPDRAFSQEP